MVYSCRNWWDIAKYLDIANYGVGAMDDPKPGWGGLMTDFHYSFIVFLIPTMILLGGLAAVMWVDSQPPPEA